MKLLTGCLRLVAAGVLVVAGAGAAGLVVKAQIDPQRAPLVTFGLTGITRGQIARLSVTNVPTHGFPPGPCRASLSFVDARRLLDRTTPLVARWLGPSSIEYARVLNASGMLDKYTGRFDAGVHAYTEALAIADTALPGDPELAASILHNLGGIEHARGDYVRASGHPMPIECSFGVTALVPGMTLDEALRDADAAMYAKKGIRRSA